MGLLDTYATYATGGLYPAAKYAYGAAGSPLGKLGSLGDQVGLGDATHVSPYEYAGPGHGELGADQARTDARGLPREIDMAGANAAAGQQTQLGQQYRDVLAGKGESVAAQQQRQGLAQAQAQAAGIAASARGGAGAQLAASQAALRGNAETGQAAVGKAAELRAGEQAAARGQYGSLLAQQRGSAFGEQQGLADLAMKNRTTNDARYMGLLNARQDAERIKAGAVAGAQSLNATADAAAMDRRRQFYGGVISAGAGLAGMCCSPGTLILTPAGERRVADIRVGDVVYSTIRGERVEALVASVTRRTVHAHSVARVHLDSGRMLLVSASHPTADGRTLGDLRPGDSLDGAIVTKAAIVPYDYSHTYDIRPDTPDGFYWAEGALIGSTIPAPAVRMATIAGAEAG